MPRDATSMPICSPAKIECIEESVEHIEQTGFDITGTIGTKCACLPGYRRFQTASRGKYYLQQV